jgi:spermidine/putrescine transport system ATP-binding protein
VSVRVEGGEFFTLLGPSGCGKTTLLRLIAGFEPTSAGEIRLAGEPVQALPPHRRPVNTVFQSYALFPHLTVERNVAFGLEMRRVPRAEAAREVGRALEMVRLSGLERRFPRELSGGQQQRVALARALANRPRVLLLDEPLSALDLKLRKEMQLELKRLQADTGITFVFVTHDQEEALAMSDRVAVMDRGRVLQVGRPADIYDRPASRFVADFIGDTDLIEARCVRRVGREGAVFRTAGGGELAVHEAPGVEPGQAVTLAIRPERVEPVLEGEGLPATLRTVVFLGSDSILHASLADGTMVRARLQNRGRVNGADLREGAPLRLRFPSEALRVLAD